ncbi:MAG: HAD family hydrolase [Planctomycetota bacterium]
MSWTITDADLRHRDPDLIGSIFHVGNGRHATRGTPSEATAGVYRGVYLSGSYTRAPMGLMYYFGAPDWLTAYVAVGGERARAEEESWELDLQRGLVRRRATLVHGENRFALCEERFASFADEQLAAQQVSVERIAGAGDIRVVLGIDAGVRQSRAKYYAAGDTPCAEEAGLRLGEIERLDSRPEGDLAAVLISPPTGHRTAVAGRVCAQDGRAGTQLDDPAVTGMGWECSGAGPHVFTKLVAICADLPGFEDAQQDVVRHAARIRHQSYAEARAAHERAVAAFWDMGDVVIDGDTAAQRSVRYAVWSTRTSAPLDGGRSSMAAKNLTGDWYRGAVFWDMEAFQLPLLSAIDPPRARNHVTYRVNRLNAARRLAAQDGYRGARFPGQSYDTGLEDPPCLGGLGRMEIHVSLEVAWGMLHYHQLSGDHDFMLAGGLAVVASVADFWSSKVTQDPDGSFHLRGICGPDELHKPIDDNAYTNQMIRELLRRAEAVIAACAKLDPRRVDAVLQDAHIDEARREHWCAVVEGLHVAQRPDGVMDQFAGHHRLVNASPVALKAGGMGADAIGKQADTVLLFQMIPWVFDRETVHATYRVFAPLCNQTSSLSLCTHALVAARLGLVRDAKRYFDMAAGVDLDDSMGNGDHGIHGAGQGGIWQAVVWGFGGLSVSPGQIRIDPHLPPGWSALRYRFYHHCNPITVSVDADGFTLRNDGEQPVQLTAGDTAIELAPATEHRATNNVEWHQQGLDGVVVDADALLAGDRAREGASEMLATLRAAGLPLAIVALREQLAAALESAGLSQPGDAIIDAAVIREGKPDPQGYLVATQHLGLLPWNCIGIGADADAVRAIHNAGMLAVGIATDADHVVSDPRALDLADCQELQTDYCSSVNPYLERNLKIVAAEQK